MILALHSTMSASDDWWASLKHGGLLIAPSKLNEFFVVESLEPLSYWVEDRLRRDVTRLQNGEDEHLSTFLDTVLEDVLGLTGDWQKGSQVDRLWSYPAITREIIRPRRVWQSPQGDVLPVFVADGQEASGRVARLGIGRGKRSVTRVVEWLRQANQKVALLTNGYQWRLIHAGADYDAWCEWDITFWFEEGQPGLQVTALRLLLGVQALQSEQASGLSPLMAAIDASRQGQGEISEVLGERVRQAVELLIRESSESLAQMQTSDVEPVSSRQIYIAATRIIMRCVVILFAEARDLLPRDNPIYHSAYGLQGLREQLDRRAGGRATERLRQGVSAWMRLLALFRLVDEGSAHEALPVPCYGGGLFTQGDRTSNDAILRVLYAFEHSSYPLSDAVVYRILELLCRSKVRVRQGRGSTWVEAPVDFSDLSSEYIGILYEGLLDFELRQSPVDQPMVFLNLGDQPVLPLTRLESMDDKALAELVKQLKKKAKLTTAEESEDEVEEAETEDEAEEAVLEVEEPDSDVILNDADLAKQVQERAQEWAIRAVKAGNLVTKPRSKKPAALAAYEETVSNAAITLIVRIILPGEWFLVRWGGTRKGSGTFYTPRSLAAPTVYRTLEALVHNNDGTLKRPGEILALKVCDPAMGSGSFLISALRYLTEKLYASLYAHGCIEAHGQYSLCRLADGAETNSFEDLTLPLPLDHDDFEKRLKANLKRFVVSECLYGVDFDELAVEFARISLWVETMDRTLLFTFLDHKLKCGNALVGCWVDQFADYPVMAWKRDGGDGKYNNFVHHFRSYIAIKGKKQGQTLQTGDKWTQKLKDIKSKTIEPELKTLLQGLMPNQQIPLPLTSVSLPKPAYQLYSEALKARQELSYLTLDPEAQQKQYDRAIKDNPDQHRLKQAFDTWCAIWFWTGEYLELAPTPLSFFDPEPEALVIVEKLRAEFKFFHWEIEFNEVFRNGGFSAVIGNPPWEIQKPNSKEFFSNIDPLYRAYGKQEALRVQQELFEKYPEIEEAWLNYCAKFKALSNWSKYVSAPFGDYENAAKEDRFNVSRATKENQYLHDLWREDRKFRLKETRSERRTDERIPYRYQGSADINTYKMFLEVALMILGDNGRLGMITPSGIYSDKGSSTLRSQFIFDCNWHWLYGFENRQKIFSIDSRFKFCSLILQKGNETDSILVAFMQQSLQAWEEAEEIHVLSYPRKQIEQFSPKSKTILEICSNRDLEILKKIYKDSVLIEYQKNSGWEIDYGRELEMTDDSKKFSPLPTWKDLHYEYNCYGFWLNSANKIAFPLYEGRMIGQFDFSEKHWISGKGRSAVWENISFDKKELFPQFLLGKTIYDSNSQIRKEFKFAVMRVSSSTNERTVIAAAIPPFPSQHSIFTGTVGVNDIPGTLLVSAFLNSFVFDFVVRRRCVGVNVTGSVLDESPLPVKSSIEGLLETFLVEKISALSIPHICFSIQWLALKKNCAGCSQKNWFSNWAITPYERLRLRAILDAVVAHLYGLNTDDFAWILRDCDHPIERVNDNAIARSFDPKGFWRVDKDKPPELRHTVLSQVAFNELNAIGLEAFLNLNNGEGWMLPETLRLADYRLGNSDRAHEFVPVAEKMGDRFLPWQLEGTPEESWEECDRHAENLRRLLGNQPTTINALLPTPDSPSLNSDRQLNLLPNDIEQLNLFDSPNS